MYTYVILQENIYLKEIFPSQLVVEIFFCNLGDESHKLRLEEQNEKEPGASYTPGMLPLAFPCERNKPLSWLRQPGITVAQPDEARSPVCQEQLSCPHCLAQSQAQSTQSVSSVAQSCPTLCYPMDYSTPGFAVHHQLPRACANSCPSSPLSRHWLTQQVNRKLKCTKVML